LVGHESRRRVKAKQYERALRSYIIDNPHVVVNKSVVGKQEEEEKQEYTSNITDLVVATAAASQ